MRLRHLPVLALALAACTADAPLPLDPDDELPDTPGPETPTAFLATEPSPGPGGLVHSFVSASPGALRGARTVVVVNRRTSASVTAPTIADGFDPVAIPAALGDTLIVTVIDTSGRATPTAVPVRRRRPRVVRTDPPRGKTDVPVNAQIMIVLSEPVDRASLGSSSFRLLRGDTVIAGTATARPEASWIVDFVPAQRLAPVAAYRFEITGALRDLGGDSLEQTEVVSFTTSALVSFTWLAAGATHTCGLTTERRVYCWGDGRLGQIGVTTPQDVPVLLVGAPVTDLVVRGEYTCVLRNLLTCWGAARKLTPQSLDPLAAIPRGPWRTIAGSARALCATDSTGTTTCRGGISEDANMTFYPAADPETLVAAAGRLQLGESHQCFVDTGNRALCRGFTSFGQTGDSLPRLLDSAFIRVPFTWPFRAVAGGPVYRLIATGLNFTCVIRLDRQAECWGYGDQGQLGTGSVGSRPRPTPVAGGLAFDTIVAGDRHTCGIAAGDAWCWGPNDWGEIGDGTTIQRTAPQKVAGGLQFVQITIGERHTCGLAADGVAYCWGENSYGQLGDAARGTRRLTPTRVSGQP